MAGYSDGSPRYIGVDANGNIGKITHYLNDFCWVFSVNYCIQYSYSLQANPNLVYSWVPSKNGKTVLDAFKIGSNYIAQAIIKGEVVLGTVVPGVGMKYFDAATNSYKYSSTYEVLIVTPISVSTTTTVATTTTPMTTTTVSTTRTPAPYCCEYLNPLTPNVTLKSQ